jgi:16S rRNA (uracil1498-N3)-methyltransferase
LITLLVSREELQERDIEISGSAYRHLFRARRLPSEARLRLTDGWGRARWARVERIERRSARLHLEEEAPDNEAEMRLHLLIAPPKPQRASWLVEKATEVGVEAVRLLSSERSAPGYGPATLERLRRVAAAAVEQCHRSFVPEITGMHGWEKLDELLASSRQRWMLDPEGGESLQAGEGSAVLLVGPEGGWTPDERQDLLARGCRAAGLGPRTLRVETAAVVGCGRLLLGE